ncbi:MAG: rimK [Candidatus Saccharibacteria bacterium]|nr:rimK [Candidatus Saccharibacteria bacterium]
MKNILILCRRDDRESYDTQATMLAQLQALEDPDAQYSGADYEDLLFDFDGQELRVTDTVSGNDLRTFDTIFLIGWFKTKALDDVARSVAHYAAAHGVAFANSEAFYGRSFTKLSQCVLAALNGVRVTPFLFSLDRQVLHSAILQADRPWPMIVKAVAASRGQNNFLVHEAEEMERILTTDIELNIHYIVQEFVPNDGDYRILVMGGKVRMAIHRKAQSTTHLNNTSQGATATLVAAEDLPSAVQAEALKLAQLFHREVTGVDMVKHRDNENYYFLEANNMPQLSTGSFVPEKMQQLAAYLKEITAIVG